MDAEAEVRPDLVQAEPSQMPPGELVELTFPEESERGTPWVLERQDSNNWHAQYLLWSDANGATPAWVGHDEEDRWAWDDVGIGGPGPDVVLVPDVAALGHYRLCTVNAQDNFCTAIELAD